MARIIQTNGDDRRNRDKHDILNREVGNDRREVMFSLEDNKRMAQRWLQLIDEHKVEEICEMTAPTWRMHGGPPKLSLGPAGVRELFQTIGPIDQKWTIEDVIAEADKVVVRATNTCIQESFLGIPGWGQRQVFTATFIHWIRQGKIIETWRNADDLGRLLQLGARIEPGTSES